MDGPHADAIRASEAAHAGGGGLPSFVDGHLVDAGTMPAVDQVAAPDVVKALQW